MVNITDAISGQVCILLTEKREVLTECVRSVILLVSIYCLNYFDSMTTILKIDRLGRTCFVLFFQCLTNLGNHFGQMINISSVLSSIVDEENELNFKNLFGDLHNLVYDVICSMFHLGMASGISLPVSFTAPEIENECVNVNSILLRWKLIKNIELVAFILREKYAEW